MNNPVGFSFSFRKGSGLKTKLRDLFWEFRYAWQRAGKGYDFTDVFELGFNFIAKMPVLLKEFKKYNDTLFPDLDKNDGSSLSEEETKAILDEMIFYFENCDEDQVYKRLYGTDPYEQRFEKERWEAVQKEKDRCWNEAMRLFTKWGRCLWY